MQRRSALFRQLAKADLLVLDDFGLTPLSDETVRDLLEILDHRYDDNEPDSDREWHAYLGDCRAAPSAMANGYAATKALATRLWAKGRKWMSSR